MDNPSPPPRLLRFGPFEADLHEEIVRRNGLPLRLQDQPLKLLLLLLQHPGQIVTRHEMRSRLWPTDSFGDFDNGLNVAIRKIRAALGDDTGRPRYIETVPRRGYRFVAGVEEILPATPKPVPPKPAPANPESAIEPLRTEPAPGPQPSAGPASRRYLLGAALALLALLAMLGFLTRSHWQPSPPATAALPAAFSTSARKSVAVLGFRNSSGRPEDAWLSTALSEMFSTELAAGDHLRLISGEDVAHLRQTQPSLDVDSVSGQTAGQLRKILGTDLIVSGSYVAVGGSPSGSSSRQVRLDVRLQDAGSGEILTEVSDNGTEQALFQLVGNVGERLRQKLGVSGISSEEHSQVLAAMPANREARELYSNGLVQLRAYDATAARVLLERSIAADPQFPLAHAALSDAWMRLGYDQRAIEEAQKASDLAVALLPTERLQVQARLFEVKGDWERAAEAYRSLFESFPDDADFQVRLAASLTRAGKGKEALALLDSSMSAHSAQLELAAANAAQAIGNLDRAAQASAQAAANARAQGQLLVLATALRTQGLVLESLKQLDKAMAVTEEARQIFEKAGDRFAVASVLEVQANVLTDRGDLAGALTRYEQELDIARNVGNKRGQASALNNIALVLNQQGDLERSRSMWEQSAAAFQELEDRSNTAVVLINIGGVLKDQGDLAGARSRYNQALSMARQMNDAGDAVLALRAIGTVLDAQGDFAGARNFLSQAEKIDSTNGQTTPDSDSLIDLADVLLHQGDLAGAKQTYQNALTVSKASGEKSLGAYALLGLGRVALLNADLTAARASFTQALELRKALGERLTVAETEMALAELSLADGHAADAEPALRRVQALFRQAGKQEDLVTATSLVIRVLLDKSKDAANTAEAARELASLPASVQIDSRLATLLAKGRVACAQGNSAAAQAAFQSVQQQATRVGYRAYSFESSLVTLECMPASAQRRQKLEDLAGRSSQAGFQLFAQDAHRLASVAP
jgi:tetratricopeptide (TPR) repeat protein/DNA-binding winged helix-turn-helix (wHTH) protein